MKQEQAATSAAPTCSCGAGAGKTTVSGDCTYCGLPRKHRTPACSCGGCNDLRAHLVTEHGCNGPYIAGHSRAMLDAIHSGGHSCNRDGQCVLAAGHEGGCDWGDDGE